MDYQGLSDRDLTAVISFLRSQPPVRSDVPEHRLNLLGKALMAFMIEPVGPASTPPRASPPAVASIARGEYLANNVAACVVCHTDRSRRDGSFIGPKFAGGQRMDVAADPGYRLRSAQPHARSPDEPDRRVDRGRLRHAVSAGRADRGDADAMGAFARMTEDDLRSIFTYLHSLPPVERHTGPPVQKK